MLIKSSVYFLIKDPSTYQRTLLRLKKCIMKLPMNVLVQSVDTPGAVAEKNLQFAAQLVLRDPGIPEENG
jgi:hypothetical protein